MGQISSSFQLPSDPPDSLHYLGNTVYNFILFAGIRLVWRVPPGCVGEYIKTCSHHTPPPQNWEEVSSHYIEVDYETCDK